MAIYAADIQINVKNKGDLKKLENRFKQINIAAVSLEKTLKGLGRRNAIKVDTRAAMSAISALEARIRGLNRTVRVDARTSGGGGDSSGMSGAAIPLAAGVFGGGKRQKKQSVATQGLFDIGQSAMSAHIKKLNQDIKQQQSIVENFGETAKRSQDKYAQAIENVNKHQATSKKQLKDLDKVIKEQPWAKFSKGFLPKTAGDNFLKFATAYLRTNSKINDKITNTNKELVDQATHQKKINEVAQSNLEGQKKQLKLREQILQATTKEQDQTINKALMSDREVDLHKQINQEKVKGFNAFSQQLKHQQKINGELVAGRQPAEALTRQFEAAKKATKDAFGNVVRLREELAKPARTGGLLGSFKDLGKKGAMGAAGRGALASSALIPGVAPLAVGGFAGASGGGGLAGGGIGVAVAAAVQGTVALVEFARASANVAAEMDRMRIALTGVVPDQESYNTSLEKVSTLSKKYGISQRLLLKGFTQLQASADAAGFGVEDTGNLMEGLLARTLASGKGLEEFKGVMLAASQILSKGKLQAEEARGQIGERIPGFMADLAASMNISMKELDKAMEQGEVTLKDFFKLGEDLLKNNEQTALKLAESYANAGMRLNTAVENLQASFGKLSMVLGAKFQNQATDLLEFFTKVVDKINGIVIASIRAQLALDSLIDKTGLTNFSIEFKGGTKIGLTDRERRDLDQELAILTGKQTVRKKSKKDIKDENDLLAKQAVAWKKIEDRLRIDTQYQKDRIALGEKEAEIQRELAEIQLQFEGRDISDIEEKIRALKELEDQTVSNSVAFKDLQQDAAKRLKDLQNPVEQLRMVSEALADGFAEAVKGIVRGTKSIGDAVAAMLNRVADAMLQHAADMAAGQITKGFIGLFSKMFAGAATSTTASAVDLSPGGTASFQYVNAPSMGYAKGGYVDRPTNAVIGEGGEGEYVIPESKLASSLSRFQAGHRGSSVVPGGVGGSSSSGGSGEVTVNYTGPTLNFNGDEYVPRSAVPQIINSAAMAGASAGRANTMKDLKNSRSQRARLGL